MARLLFAVEDTFLIEGRGLVPVPGIVPQGDERFRVGDPIRLKRPDGSEIEWKIAGLEMLYPRPPQNDVAILLNGLGKDDVPIGTEIWSMDNDDIRSTYEWNFLTKHPPTNTPFLMGLLGEFIGNETAAKADFSQNLRTAAFHAIDNGDNPVLIRQALQCLAHVGEPNDVQALTSLLQHEDPLVVRDARTCIFEIKHR
jgi:hypothetical protein